MAVYLTRQTKLARRLIRYVIVRTISFLMTMIALQIFALPGNINPGKPSGTAALQKMLALADTFYFKAEYLQATDITVRVLNYYKATNNIAGQVVCLNRLGDIFRGAQNTQLCREHIGMAMKLALASNDSLGISTAENILAAALFEIGPKKFDSSATLARESLKYSSRHNLERLTCYNLNILGMIESSRGDNAKALAYLEEAWPIMQRVNSNDEPLLLTNMARVLFRMGKIEKAEALGLQAFSLAKQKKIVWYTIMSAQFLGNLYHVTHRDQTGYPIMKELVDQLVFQHHETTEIRIRERKALKAAEQKEKENEGLRISQASLSQQAEQRQLLQMLFGLLLLISVIFIVLLLCQKRRLTAANAKLAKANATLQTFISIIAHDLKNPMNTILGFTDILLHDSDTIDQEERVRAINYTNRAAYAAFKLLEQLLEWARIQAGIIKAEPQKILLNDMIQEVLSTVQPMAVLKEQTVTCSISLNVTIFADRNMMLTLFRNLLSNAVKFTPRHGSINVSEHHNGNIVTVSILDTGNGMAPGQLEKLFMMDQQIKSKGTDGETGTGLGLLLCKEYIDKNHGKISAESIEGEGSTFHVVIPASK